MPHQFDLTNLPLVRAGFTGDITEQGITAYLRDLEALLDRRVRFGMVFDVLESGNVDRAAMTLHAEMLKRRKADCERQWVALALVFDSPAKRFLLSSLLLLVRLPMPYVVVSNVADGMRFVAKRFSEERIALPAPLVGTSHRSDE